jgi:molybdopterin synthase sulfur carrier subunit
MKLTIKLFATLRQGRFKIQERTYPDTTTVEDIVKQLSIAKQDLGIIFVNGKYAELNTALHEGDTLSIFPPIGGG